LRCAGNGDLKRGDLAIEGSLEETDELVEIGDSAGGIRTIWKTN
jgi:hypothetical protein